MPPIKEREDARRERQLQKEQKRKRIAWIVIIVVVVILIIMKAFEFNFNSVKNQFTNDKGSFSISATDNSAFPVTLDSSKIKAFAMNDKLGLLTDSSVTVLNLSNAEVNYSFSHGYSNPIMSQSGSYFCLIDQGSNRMRLDSIKDNVFEINTERSILCADVAKNGAVVYATQGENSKSTVYVVNKNEINKMTFDVNDGYVVDVAIDASGKKIAIAAVNSKDAKLVTTVYTYSVGKAEQIKSFDFVGTNLLDLKYSSSSDLFVVGTNCVSVISNQKKQKVAFDVGTINTNCFSYTDNGELVIAYSKYEGATQNTLAYVNSTAKVKMSLELQQKAKYVSSSSNNVTALFNDKVVTYSLNNGKEKEVVACDETITSVNRLSSKIFVTRQQLVDVLG